MLESLSHWSSRIIESAGSSWPVVGWVLFGAWFLGPYFLYAWTAGFLIWMLIGLVLLAWWAIDALDQQVAGWQILTGIVMIGIGVLPRGGFLLIACWVIYWTRVRE